MAEEAAAAPPDQKPSSAEGGAGGGNEDNTKTEDTAAAAAAGAPDATEEKKEDPSATAGNKPSSVKAPAASDPPADAGPPITLEQAVSYDNPAADPRKMRRIIAEDPEWTLATVPLLSELTMENIITNFPQNPILKDVAKKTPPLPAKYQTQILGKLSTEVPIEITANLIEAEEYWKRCCDDKWPVCDISKYGNSYKRLYFERQLQEMIEAFIPGTTDLSVLKNYLTLVGRFIVRVDVRQLLPPIREPSKDDGDLSDTGSDAGDVIENDSHFDFNDILQLLPNMEEFSVVYGVDGCLLNFEWNLFLFTSTDCLNLSKFVQKCTHLKKLSVQRSKVDDEKVRVMIKHMLNHPNLEELDLSFNKIGDKGARAVGKLINNSKITRLNLLDNQIGHQGMAAIAHALKKPTALKHLNLRLNRLGDEGAQSLCVSLLDNSTVETLNIAANDITEQTSQFIAQLIVSNNTLCELDLSCNQLGTDGGKQLQEAMESNTQITKLELKLAKCGQESEYCINKMLDRNLQEKLKSEEERFLSYYKPPKAQPPTGIGSKPRTQASRRQTSRALAAASKAN
ncbi:dynein regulatory complex subunit 5-like isoform X2 [Convolutriloba macropyga]|uniref:dynein regulatory complex subunit 5-like isoform X2 n=1 Tax=Convolutriloba macropyga TaxID=536237 RepID=UPI003F521434